MKGYPVTDTAAARMLGEALRTIGYSESAVYRLLGDDAYTLDRDDGPVADRRLPQEPLGTAIRLFFLELAVARRSAVRALGARAIAALEATGLAEVTAREIVPRVRIIPVGTLLVASDDYPDPDGEDPPDFVAAYTPTSQLCASLTPRRHVDRALDVGTGSGVLALLSSQHARHVVATDVNPRALAYTELNAALNGITNVECRRGSLFEPVEGESFDLITSNAPYVVSPETRFAYRDAGLDGDEVSERVVAEAAKHLRQGGFATLLVSWIAADPDDPDERILAWTDATDCDTWILPVWGSDPLDHASLWNEPLKGDDDRFASALDEWLGYLDRLGARWVTEGAVVLHRGDSERPTTRVDEIDEDVAEGAGAQVERAFAARTRLAELTRDDLLDTRLAVAMPLRFEQEVRPRGKAHAAELELAAGMRQVVDIAPGMIDLLARLDGKTPLRRIVRDTADRRRAASLCAELLELGALTFA